MDEIVFLPAAVASLLTSANFRWQPGLHAFVDSVDRFLSFQILMSLLWNTPRIVAQHLMWACQLLLLLFGA